MPDVHVVIGMRSHHDYYEEWPVAAYFSLDRAKSRVATEEVAARFRYDQLRSRNDAFIEKTWELRLVDKPYSSQYKHLAAEMGYTPLLSEENDLDRYKILSVPMGEDASAAEREERDR
jgi:hypothetical protein